VGAFLENVGFDIRSHSTFNNQQTLNIQQSISNTQGFVTRQILTSPWRGPGGGCKYPLEEARGLHNFASDLQSLKGKVRIDCSEYVVQRWNN
jgi:hypothetical protein